MSQILIYLVSAACRSCLHNKYSIYLPGCGYNQSFCYFARRKVASLDVFEFFTLVRNTFDNLSGYCMNSNRSENLIISRTLMDFKQRLKIGDIMHRMKVATKDNFAE